MKKKSNNKIEKPAPVRITSPSGTTSRWGIDQDVFSNLHNQQFTIEGIDWNGHTFVYRFLNTSLKANESFLTEI